MAFVPAICCTRLQSPQLLLVAVADMLASPPLVSSPTQVDTKFKYEELEPLLGAPQANLQLPNGFETTLPQLPLLVLPPLPLAAPPLLPPPLPVLVAPPLLRPPLPAPPLLLPPVLPVRPPCVAALPLVPPLPTDVAPPLTLCVAPPALEFVAPPAPVLEPPLPTGAPPFAVAAPALPPLLTDTLPPLPEFTPPAPPNVATLPAVVFPPELTGSAPPEPVLGAGVSVLQAASGKAQPSANAPSELLPKPRTTNERRGEFMPKVLPGRPAHEPPRAPALRVRAHALLMVPSQFVRRLAQHQGSCALTKTAGHVEGSTRASCSEGKFRQLLAFSGRTPKLIALSEKLQRLANLIGSGGTVVLTGAGVSTDSGIPDYRDDQGDWKRQRPVQYRDFVDHEATRKRYWSRSMLGWPRLQAARPNAAHQALSTLQQRGLFALLVTQNVDGLHQAAGSSDVVDLHGRLDRVVCLGCGHALPRDELQARLVTANPGWLEQEAGIAPDGDADLQHGDCADFSVVPCPACGGVLKPDVVFFGESVPRVRVDHTLEALATARALLVIGSSLMVYSGFRFARAAQQRGVPIALVNRGRTRADELSELKLAEDAGSTLTHLVEVLAQGSPKSHA